MRTLVVLRHAKSDRDQPVGDRDRPLAARGRRQAPEAGRWLAANLDRIDLAVVSPAARARQTWDLVAAELTEAGRPPPELRLDERVYAATWPDLATVVQELPDDADTVVLVGHNPAVEDLVEALTRVWVPMPTSTLALVEVAGSWSDARPGWARMLTTGRPPDPLRR